MASRCFITCKLHGTQRVPDNAYGHPIAVRVADELERVPDKHPRHRLLREAHDAGYALAARCTHYIGEEVRCARYEGVRIVDYKTNPSLHECNSKCINATGHVCECSCGGKNHGVG